MREEGCITMDFVTNVQNDRREGLFTQHPRCYRRMAGCQTLPDRFLPTKTREKKYRNDGSEIAVTGQRFLDFGLESARGMS